MNDFDSDDVFASTAKVWAFAIAAIIATILVFGVLRPYFADLDTEGVRRTHDYISSQQSALRLMSSDYARLSTEIVSRGPSPERDALIRQRAAIREQMRGVADTIPRHIPHDVAGHLQEYP